MMWDRFLWLLANPRTWGVIFFITVGIMVAALVVGVSGAIDAIREG
jgi:hypothetical protein